MSIALLGCSSGDRVEVRPANGPPPTSEELGDSVIPPYPQGTAVGADPASAQAVAAGGPPAVPPSAAPTFVLSENSTDPIPPTSPAEPALVDPTLPLLGGTLLVSRAGRHAIMSVPDADAVVSVNLETLQIEQQAQLPVRSVPTQLVEDDQGLVHVVLRELSTIASIDLGLTADGSGELYADGNPVLRQVCAAPRGITFDELSAELVVVCRSGEMAWFAGMAPAPHRTTFVGLDARDVIAGDDLLYVSRYKSAEVLEVSREGDVLRTLKPKAVTGRVAAQVFQPHVAHRLRKTDSGVALLHQRATQGTLTRAYYSAVGCSGGVSHNTVSVLQKGAEFFASTQILPGGALLDMALSDDGENYAVVVTADGGQSGVVSGRLTFAPDDPCELAAPTETYHEGNISAVTFDATGRLLIQSRDPNRLEVVGEGMVALPRGSPVSDGMRLFYTPNATGVACASCHPEGQEDGVIWRFDEFGLRRTQTLSGQVSATQPLHWEGERHDWPELLSDTLVQRMLMPAPDPATVLSLSSFLDGLPRPKPRLASELYEVRAGAEVFEQLSCDDCHAGPLYTDNLSHDVGTGGSFQTPSLVGVGYRAPFMHHGCAPTLLDRFSHCGGDYRHGAWQSLTELELHQLVSFLESL